MGRLQGVQVHCRKRKIQHGPVLHLQTAADH